VHVRTLSPDERRERGIQLASLVRDRIDLVDAHKEAAAEHRERLKGLDKRIASLSFDVQNGFEIVTGQQELFVEVREAVDVYPSLAVEHAEAVG
jgi:hypothetical protein